MHLTKLFPLFETDFDIELGSEAWRKLIRGYKNYSKPQRSSIPPFSLINNLFDPQEILQYNQNLLPPSRKVSSSDSEEDSTPNLELEVQQQTVTLNQSPTKTFEKEMKSKAKDFSLKSIQSKEQLYFKDNIDVLFMQLVSDTKSGERTREIKQKMIDLCGVDVFVRDF